MWLKFQGVWLLLFIASCIAAAAGKGLTREVNGLQPQCLLRVFPAGSQGQGNFPAVWAAPGHDHISHNTQKHFHHLLPPPDLSLSLCVFSLLSRSNLAPPSTSSDFLNFIVLLPSHCLLQIRPCAHLSPFLLTFGTPCPALPVRALEVCALSS